MSWLLCFLVLGSPSFLFSFLYKRRFEESMPLTTFSVILILFIFGLIDQLKIGLIIVIALCIAMGIAGMVLSMTKKKTIAVIKQVLTPAFFIFLFLSIFIWYIHRGIQLSEWDEFTQWGKVSKAMFLTNKISTYTSIDLVFRSYPPAISLFQYFVSFFRGAFYEADLIRSYSILGLIMFLPFFKNVDWKNKKTIISSLVLMILAPLLFFNNYYTSIYVDPMLAMFFGYCLAEIYLYSSGDKFSCTRICLALAILPIIKESGLFLAFIASAIFIFQMVHLKKKSNEILDDTDIKYQLKQNSSFFRIPYISKIKADWPYLFIIIIPFISKMLWDMNMLLTNTQQVFSAPVNWNILFRIITGSLIDYRRTVIDHFITSLSTVNLTFGFLPTSYFVWFGILATLLFVICKLTKEDSKTFTKFNIAVLLGLILYTIGLLITYMFKFSEYEAIRMASFSRYISTYLQAVFLSITMIVIAGAHDYHQRNHILLTLTKMVLIIMLTIFIPLTSVTDTALGKRAVASYYFREQYHALVNKVELLDIEPGSKLWIISQHSVGTDYWVIQYDLMEYKANPMYTWSLSEQYSQDDCWTCNLTVSDWAQQLIDYDYVLIYKPSEVFIDKYKTLFEDENSIQPNSVYEVVKDGTKIKLVLK